jgi:hypothetical protein
MEERNQPVLVLRCYAYSADNGGKHGFYAVCIDLNLFTWRPTLRQAKKSLHDAIRGYLETVSELARDENLTPSELRKRVLRPAPFWPYKARYYAFGLLDTIKVDTHSTFNTRENLPTLGAAA